MPKMLLPLEVVVAVGYMVVTMRGKDEMLEMNVLLSVFGVCRVGL